MMFLRRSRSSKAERLLVVSLSNIGDVILTFPVLDALAAAFPRASIDVIVGPKAASLLAANPAFADIIIYDKRQSWWAKCRWFLALRRRRYDLVIDLRNSMLPFLLNTAAATRPAPRNATTHMRQKHLARLSSVLPQFPADIPRRSVHLAPAQEAAVDAMLGVERGFVLLAPGAADHRKRWGEDGFLRVLDHLRRRGLRVVLVGDAHDAGIAAALTAGQCDGVTDLCGRTSLPELAGVIARARLALTNDSGIMHLASYLDVPTVALFGPTDPFFYGPWSRQSVVLRRGNEMGAITAADVISEVDAMLARTMP